MPDISLFAGFFSENSSSLDSPPNIVRRSHVLSPSSPTQIFCAFSRFILVVKTPSIGPSLSGAASILLSSPILEVCTLFYQQRRDPCPIFRIGSVRLAKPKLASFLDLLIYSTRSAVRRDSRALAL